MKKHSGFSLFELMIASCLSMMVVGIAMGLHQSTYHLIANIQAWRELRHRAIRITTIIEQDIKLAGYRGCRKSLKGIDSTESDIMVRHMAYPAAMLINPVRDNRELEVGNVHYFRKGEVAMIADCLHAEKFVIDHILQQKKQQTIYAKAALHYHYGHSAEVAPFVEHRYFVLNNILYISDTHGRNFKIAEGVANLKVQYDTRSIDMEMLLMQDTIKQPWHIHVAL